MSEWRGRFLPACAIVSAVGQRTDVAIVRFVADLRAPTPSAAAEMISRNQRELLRQLQSGQRALKWRWTTSLPTAIVALPGFSRLQQQHPQLRLAVSKRSESLRQRMRFALETQIKRADQRQQRRAAPINKTHSREFTAPRAVFNAGIPAGGPIARVLASNVNLR
ncbi:MAG: exodeoxyribonuclease VII large subunit [Enterobacteriaceae bacterium]